MNIDVHRCKNCIITLDTRILDTTNSPLQHPATAAGWWINFAVSTPAGGRGAPLTAPPAPAIKLLSSQIEFVNTINQKPPDTITSYLILLLLPPHRFIAPNTAFTINSYAEIGILSHEVADEVDGLSFLWASQYSHCKYIPCRSVECGTPHTAAGLGWGRPWDQWQGRHWSRRLPTYTSIIHRAEEKLIIWYHCSGLYGN